MLALGTATRTTSASAASPPSRPKAVTSWPAASHRRANPPPTFPFPITVIRIAFLSAQLARWLAMVALVSAGHARRSADRVAACRVRKTAGQRPPSRSRSPALNLGLTACEHDLALPRIERIGEPQLDERLSADTNALGLAVDGTEQIDGKVNVHPLDLTAGTRGLGQIEMFA